jgi:hypothetical protein
MEAASSSKIQQQSPLLHIAKASYGININILLLLPAYILTINSSVWRYIIV